METKTIKAKSLRFEGVKEVIKREFDNWEEVEVLGEMVKSDSPIRHKELEFWASKGKKHISIEEIDGEWKKTSEAIEGKGETIVTVIDYDREDGIKYVNKIKEESETQLFHLGCGGKLKTTGKGEQMGRGSNLVIYKCEKCGEEIYKTYYSPPY